MCLTCGCQMPYDNHGDHRNITMDQLEQAAVAAGISTTEASGNIANAVGGTVGSTNTAANETARTLAQEREQQRSQQQHGQLAEGSPGSGQSPMRPTRQEPGERPDQGAGNAGRQRLVEQQQQDRPAGAQDGGDRDQEYQQRRAAG